MFRDSFRFLALLLAAIRLSLHCFLSIVSGFAGLYVGAEVFPSSKTPADAFYISFFILAFTDFSPKPGYGKVVVMGQLAGGIRYLIAAIPLLISRIATFASP